MCLSHDYENNIYASRLCDYMMVVFMMCGVCVYMYVLYMAFMLSVLHDGAHAVYMYTDRFMLSVLHDGAHAVYMYIDIVMPFHQFP